MLPYLDQRRQLNDQEKLNSQLYLSRSAISVQALHSNRIIDLLVLPWYVDEINQV